MAGKKLQSAKKKKMINNMIVHMVLAVLAVIWLFPIVWVILTSFRAEKGSYVSTFFPKAFTLDNYVKLFTDTSILNFPQMFMNTLFIAICSCILSAFYVLAVSCIFPLNIFSTIVIFNILKTVVFSQIHF